MIYANHLSWVLGHLTTCWAGLARTVQQRQQQQQQQINDSAFIWWCMLIIIINGIIKTRFLGRSYKDKCEFKLKVKINFISFNQSSGEDKILISRETKMGMENWVQDGKFKDLRKGEGKFTTTSFIFFFTLKLCFFFLSQNCLSQILEYTYVCIQVEMKELPPYLCFRYQQMPQFNFIQ